jgi:transcriptional regulator with GAF, ATPase, and Fis domain
LKPPWYHYTSHRNKGPFIVVNCGAIPQNLLDSELFGHEKGACTGAQAQKRGRFERADKGTIFLDEIGELTPEAQVRMLRVLQHKEIERVGGTKTISVDIRIIAATNRELQEMVDSNGFREDLYFRLNVFPITIPPLRNRQKDIPALVDYLIGRKSKELKLSRIPKLAPGAIDMLVRYRWLGNVRELENVVERELILNRHGTLTFEHLEPLVERISEPKHLLFTTRSWKLDDVISSHIKQVLMSTHGKIHGPGGAAKLLGVNPSTLRNKMNKLDIAFGRKAAFKPGRDPKGGKTIMD